MRFTDVTEKSGLSFTHVNGASGRKLLPETMGAGVAFLDFDNDGCQDLLFVNSAPGPVTSRATDADAGTLSQQGRWHLRGRDREPRDST